MEGGEKLLLPGTAGKCGLQWEALNLDLSLASADLGMAYAMPPGSQRHTHRLNKIKCGFGPGAVAQAYNPSILGGQGDWIT